MIKLEVCDYCQKCPSFDPEVVSRPETDTLIFYDPLGSIEKRITTTHGDTIVMCKNRDKCNVIHTYMEGEK